MEREREREREREKEREREGKREKEKEKLGEVFCSKTLSTAKDMYSLWQLNEI